LKKNGKHAGFYLDKILPVKQVESIAKNKANWDIKRFNEFLPTRSLAKLRVIGGSKDG